MAEQQTMTEVELIKIRDLAARDHRIHSQGCHSAAVEMQEALRKVLAHIDAQAAQGIVLIAHRDALAAERETQEKVMRGLDEMVFQRDETIRALAAEVERLKEAEAVIRWYAERDGYRARKYFEEHSGGGLSENPGLSTSALPSVDSPSSDASLRDLVEQQAVEVERLEAALRALASDCPIEGLSAAQVNEGVKLIAQTALDNLRKR